MVTVVNTQIASELGTSEAIVKEQRGHVMAKMQARLALEHGKKVFLIRSLTEHQQWARTYVEKRGAVQVDDVTEVVAALASPDRIHAADQRREQLVMDFG